MSNHSPFPIIQVEGGPYECGLQHGDQVKAIIKETVANYQNTFEKSFNRKWEEVLKLARRFLPAIEAYDPDVIEEMKGIAKGSGQTFEDILVINARSELVFLARTGGKTELEQADGCTVMAATPEATENGHMIVGHNIDWLAATQKTYIILKKKKKSGLDCVTFLEAGIVGKTGFNAAGIVSFGNGMVTDKMRPGIPTQVILNKVLNAHTVAEAMELFLPPNRAGSVNRVIASAQGLCINIEAAPDEFNYLYPEDGIIVHTNHFLGQNPKIRDMNALSSPNTLTRRYQAYKLLSAERGRITKEIFKKIFRNHVDKPNSVCMHQDPHRPKGRESIQTVVSLILDISDFKLDIAMGPPCEHEYVTLDFSDIRQ
jgi:isopenicillin-N N-acyltransferase like protein